MLRRPLEITQYTSYAFGKRCREMNVMPSMGSTGDAYDNAMAERIEGWYNPHRRHSGLGRRSPVNFERRNLPQQAA
jgi:putative transposase